MELRLFAVVEVSRSVPCASTVFFRRFDSVERRHRRHDGETGENENGWHANAQALADAAASVALENFETKIVRLEAKEDAQKKWRLWPAVVKKMAAGAKFETMVVVVPRVGKGNAMQMPEVTAAVGLVEEIERVFRKQSPMRGGAMSVERIRWFLSNAAPFGSLIESSELVLQLAAQRSGRKGFAESKMVRHPSWKPNPHSSEFNESMEFKFESHLTAKNKVMALCTERGIKLPPILFEALLPFSQDSILSPKKYHLGFLVLETLNATLTDKEGSFDALQGWSIDGSIECVSYIETVCELTIKLDGLENIMELNLESDRDLEISVHFFYHPCVRAGTSSTPPGGAISFTPPLGVFTLCHYRISVPSNIVLGNAAREPQDRLLEVPKNSVNDEKSMTGTIRSVASSFASSYTIDDIGKQEVATIRKAMALHHHQKAPRSVPDFPITGNCQLAIEGSFEMNTPMSVRVTIFLSEAYNLTKEHLTDVIEVRLTSLGSARYFTNIDNFSCSTGQFERTKSGNALAWRMSLGMLNDSHCEAVLRGDILNAISEETCNPWPTHCKLSSELNSILTVPLRKDPCVEVSIWGALANYLPSGLNLRKDHIESAPPLGFLSRKSESKIFSHTAVTFARLSILPVVVQKI